MLLQDNLLYHVLDITGRNLTFSVLTVYIPVNPGRCFSPHFRVKQGDDFLQQIAFLFYDNFINTSLKLKIRAFNFP
jgi:hypothetical protein